MLLKIHSLWRPSEGDKPLTWVFTVGTQLKRKLHSSKGFVCTNILWCIIYLYLRLHFIFFQETHKLSKKHVLIRFRSEVILTSWCASSTVPQGVFGAHVARSVCGLRETHHGDVNRCPQKPSFDVGNSPCTSVSGFRQCFFHPLDSVRCFYLRFVSEISQTWAKSIPKSMYPFLVLF